RCSVRAGAVRPLIPSRHQGANAPRSPAAFRPAPCSCSVSRLSLSSNPAGACIKQSGDKRSQHLERADIMPPRAVQWHEGMFLRPHHFQMAQRNWAAMAARGDKWDAHYNWGLRSIDLDLDALANYRCVVRSLQARLRDGTQVLIPEDAVLTPVE